MTTLPRLNIVLPTRGPSGSGTWHDALDAALSLIDSHDHTANKGLPITTAAIDIDADLSFQAFGAEHLARITFDSVAALSSNNKSIFVGPDHELYYRSNSGTNIKITNSGALNVTEFAGGIGGDYASVAAAVAFDDANDRYTFKQQGGVWARMASGEVRILETGTSESLYVGLVCPSALAGSYAITLPLAAPGSTSIVQMDSSGVLTVSNTVANAVTLSSTLSATGLITATAGVTASANQHVTVSGTGEFKHGDVVLAVPGCMAASTTNFAVVSGKLTSTGAGNGQIAIPLKQGDRLKSVTFQRAGNATVDMTADVMLQTSAIAADVSQGQTTVNNVPASNLSTTVTVTSPAALAAGACLYLNIFASEAGLTACTFRYTYDRP